MPKEKKPGPGDARRRYWRKEAGGFRRRDLQAFLESRGRERLVKALLAPMKVWRNTRAVKEDTWKKLEQIVFSKAAPKEFIEMYQTSQRLSWCEARAEQTFFLLRAEAKQKFLRKTDWNAIQNAIAMEDRIAEINAEIHHYGHMEELAKRGLLESFGKLIYALREGKDPQYLLLKQSVAFFARNISRKIKSANERAILWREKLLEGKISERQAIEEEITDRILLALQNYNLADESEKLYRYLKGKAKGLELKKFLGTLRAQMKRKMQRFKQEHMLLTEFFKKPPTE